ncbi:MAG: hypothetical protein VKL59_03095 [Nostocaceae cyanobacterium]|nr:hypothetical protein [Nostocaceae cyanobacterium]
MITTYERTCFGGDIKQTRFYEEVFKEGFPQGLLSGKIKIVPRLLSFGWSGEQIAQVLDLIVAQVREAGKNQLCE